MILSKLLTTNITPSPIKTNPLDPIIFGRDGKIRDIFIALCREIKIDPNDLIFKPVDSFGGPGVVEAVKIMRFNHYESKRNAKINALKTLAKEKNGERFFEKGLYERKINMHTDLPKISGIPSIDPKPNQTMNVTNSEKNKGFSILNKNEKGSSPRSLLPIKKKTISKLLETKSFVINLDDSNSTDNDSDIESNQSYLPSYSIQDSFKKYIKNKIVEKERLRSAPHKADEYQKMKENDIQLKLKEREEKHLKEKRKREQEQKTNKLKKDDELKEKKTLLLDLKKVEEKNRRVKYKGLIEKLSKSSRNREEELRLKKEKIMKNNEDTKMRSESFFLERSREESLAVVTSLSKIESRLNRSQKLHNDVLKNRMDIANHHSRTVLAKNFKHKEDVEKEEEQSFQDFFKRYKEKNLTKKDSQSKLSDTNNTDEETISPRSYREERFKMVISNRKGLEKAWAKNVKEKVKKKEERSSTFQHKKQSLVKLYSYLKKEELKLKTDDAQENSFLLSATKERKHLEKLNKVHEQYEKLREFKNEREKILEKIRLTKN